MAEFSQDTLDRIRATWAEATIDATRVTQAFYSTLFRIDPSTKPLFVGDMDLQGRKLSQTLTFIVDHLDKMDVLVPAAVGLAERHVDYGVTPEQYGSVGQALVTTLTQVLGPRFEQADSDAWVEAYSLLSGAMIGAAYTD